MNLKRQLSFLLAACLLGSLAGCGTTAASTATPDTAAGVPAASSESPVGSTTAMGRWVETEISLGDASQTLTLSQAPALLDDGTLWQFALDCDETGSAWGLDNPQTHKFVSTDGGATWQEEALDWNAIAGQGAAITTVSVSGNGSVFFQSHKVGENQADRVDECWYAKPGGDPAKLDLAAAAAGISELELVGDSFFIDDDTLLILPDGFDQRNAAALDVTPFLYTLSTGAVLAVPDAADASGLGRYPWAARGKAEDGTPLLFYVNYNVDHFSLMQIDTSGSITALSDMPDTFTSSTVGLLDGEGNYYSLASDGLYRMTKGGTLSEQIFASAGTSLSLLFVSDGCRTPDGDFIFSMKDKNTDRYSLYRYHYDTTLPSEKAESLTVWSLEENATIRAAVLAYGKANPEVAVDYEVALSGEDGAAKDDALRTLNTELLAGNGPDVLILDGVDYQPYLDKSLLADLGPALDTAALAPGIAVPFTAEDGSVGVLPARFSVPILFGDVGDAEKLTSLDAVQQAVLACPPRPDMDAASGDYYATIPLEDRFGLYTLSVEQLLQFVMESSATALLDGSAVNTGAVRQALGFVQTVGDYYGMKNYRPAAEQKRDGNTTSYTGNDAATLWDTSLAYCQTMHARYGWETMQTPSLLDMIERNERPSIDPDGGGERLDVTAVIRPGLCDGPYLPTTLAGVNTASPKQEQALGFIKVLFGESVQGTVTEDGMPVLQSALDACLARNSDLPHYKGDPAALLAGCKTPVIINDTVNAAMLTHAKALIDGTEDLDAAVKGVESDLALYLAEQK